MREICTLSAVQVKHPQNVPKAAREFPFLSCKYDRPIFRNDLNNIHADPRWRRIGQTPAKQRRSWQQREIRASDISIIAPIKERARGFTGFANVVQYLGRLPSPHLSHAAHSILAVIGGDGTDCADEQGAQMADLTGDSGRAGCFESRPNLAFCGKPPYLSAMPRYFFHTRIDDELIRDDEGIDLPDLDAAWELAQTTVLELLAGQGPGQHLLSATLEVTDSAGEIALEFPFGEALADSVDEDDEPPVLH
jgi:hypothetical protein